MGVDRLLSEGIFTAAFPLHEARHGPSPGAPRQTHSPGWALTHVPHPCRAPARPHQRGQPLAAPARARSFSSTGPTGGSGVSTSLWTTSATTLGRKSLSTSPGWVSAAGSRAALSSWMGSPGEMCTALGGKPLVACQSWSPSALPQHLGAPPGSLLLGPACFCWKQSDAHLSPACVWLQLCPRMFSSLEAPQVSRDTYI